MFKKITLLLAVLMFVVPQFSMVQAQDMDQSTPISAYTAFNNAQVNGDIDSFKQSVLSSKFDNPTEQQLQMFKSIGAFVPQNVEVVDEQVSATEATLSLKGYVPLCESEATATVTMKKDGDVWKVDTEKWATSNNSCTYGLNSD